jgi:hypothetical protein
MSDDPNLNLGVGGGQPPFNTGPSLEDEEKAMKKGNTGLLIGAGVAALAVVVGLGFVLLNSGDDSDQYGAIGRQINGMKQENFDGFWSCALPGARLGEIRSDQDLRYAITKRASSSPTRYASLVRERCIVKLQEHEPRLRSLIPPEDLQSQLDDLTHALTDLRTGWNEYIEQLDHQQAGYDEEAGAAQLSKIAKGWYDYKRAHGALNDTIREHVQ